MRIKSMAALPHSNVCVCVLGGGGGGTNECPSTGRLESNATKTADCCASEPTHDHFVKHMNSGQQFTHASK